MSKKTSLFDYEIITNEVFYRCWHILEYIEQHQNIDDLEKEAIKATIMEALVFKGLVDPKKESLDLKTLSIVDNLDHYQYNPHPNIAGIPLWMKEKFREKSLYVTGGQPISLFLARPPQKFGRYCVYDPNIAVSTVFDDATFYNAYYISPTRGVRIEEKRPFVEVKINGELYLVDTLTKRILKSSWFKENYNMEITSTSRVSEYKGEAKKSYEHMTSTHKALAELIPFSKPVADLGTPDYAEYRYELERSKEYFPEEWLRTEELQREMREFSLGNISFIKTPKKDDN